ncbi:MAG: hypothetical protein R3A47_06695 [Polyangiales bacterium]
MRRYFFVAVCFFVVACGLGATTVGCSFKDRSGYVGPGAPNAPTLSLNTTEPRHGDALVATVGGSVDPAAQTVRYDVKWYLEGSNDATTSSLALADGGTSTLNATLAKHQHWKAVAFAYTDDGRRSDATEVSAEVLNTPPTAKTAALSTYRPIADEKLTAKIVGFEDVDGDAAVVRYRWEVDGHAAVDTTASEFDLSTVIASAASRTVEQDNVQLSVTVIASDGEEDAAPVTLGPFAILNNVTRWKAIEPIFESLAHFVRDVRFIAYDPRNERFLLYDGDSLWEYENEFGFVLLNPQGDAPVGGPADVYFDSTPGAERFIVVHGSVANAEPTKVSALNVASRGNEEWVSISTSGTIPQRRCFASALFRFDAQRLLIHGGLDDCEPTEATPYNEAWALTLTGNTGVWQNLGTSVLGANGLFGAVSVPGKTDNVAYFLGGFRKTAGGGWESSPVFRMEMSADSETITELASLQLSTPAFGVVAVPTASGAIGAMGMSVEGIQVDSTWTFDATYDQESLSTAQGLPSGLFPEPDIFAALGNAAPVGPRGVYGVHGKLGDSVAVWPGLNHAINTPEEPIYRVIDSSGLFQFVRLDTTASNLASAWSEGLGIGDGLLGIGLSLGQALAETPAGWLYIWAPAVPTGDFGIQRRPATEVSWQSLPRPLAGTGSDGEGVAAIARSDGTATILELTDASAPGAMKVADFDGSVWTDAQTSLGSPDSVGVLFAFDPGCDDIRTAFTEARRLWMHRCASNDTCAWEHIELPFYGFQRPVDAGDDGTLFWGSDTTTGGEGQVWTADLCASSIAFEQQSLVTPRFPTRLSAGVRVDEATLPTWLFFGGEAASTGGPQGAVFDLWRLTKLATGDFEWDVVSVENEFSNIVNWAVPPAVSWSQSDASVLSVGSAYVGPNGIFDFRFVGVRSLRYRP